MMGLFIGFISAFLGGLFFASVYYRVRNFDRNLNRVRAERYRRIFEESSEDLRTRQVTLQRPEWKPELESESLEEMEG